MRTIPLVHASGHRPEEVRVGVIVEGIAALLGLILFIGGLCGVVTWAVVKLVAATISELSDSKRRPSSAAQGRSCAISEDSAQITKTSKARMTRAQNG